MRAHVEEVVRRDPRGQQMRRRLEVLWTGRLNDQAILGENLLGENTSRSQDAADPQAGAGAANRLQKRAPRRVFVRNGPLRPRADFPTARNPGLVGARLSAFSNSYNIRSLKTCPFFELGTSNDGFTYGGPACGRVHRFTLLVRRDRGRGSNPRPMGSASPDGAQAPHLVDCIRHEQASGAKVSRRSPVAGGPVWEPRRGARSSPRPCGVRRTDAGRCLPGEVRGQTGREGALYDENLSSAVSGFPRWLESPSFGSSRGRADVAVL